MPALGLRRLATVAPLLRRGAAYSTSGGAAPPTRRAPGRYRARVRRLFAAALLVTLTAAPARAAEGEVVSVGPPGIAGDATYGQVLRAGPGHWEPQEVTTTYRWLRDDAFVRGARERTYELGLNDLGHRMSVQVTATATDGSTGTATSEPTDPVERATFTQTLEPTVEGSLRFTHTVTADPGSTRPRASRTTYQWIRSGEPIPGATSKRYTFAPQDVGRRVRVQVTTRREGYRPLTTTSDPQARIRHRVDVRRKVTYSITTRGHVTADLEQFARQAQQTYDDPRGWRARGVQFTRVAKGGSFTLVLAEASTVPSFSSGCSAEYSCRVGRYVIINQTRWLHASPPWNAAGESLRDYRHLVVNHETGHWLGKGHAGCPKPGAVAPVMMQQSKGTQGCRFNPWPTSAEPR